MAKTEFANLNIVEEREFIKEPMAKVDWQRNVTENFKKIDEILKQQNERIEQILQDKI